MAKKKIAWITPTCYVDVDLPIIKELQSVYNIHWFVVLQPKDGENTKAYIEETLGKDKIVIITYEWQVYRMRSFKNALFIYRLIREMKEGNPTVYYTSEYALPTHQGTRDSRIQDEPNSCQTVLRQYGEHSS